MVRGRTTKWRVAIIAAIAALTLCMGSVIAYAANSGDAALSSLSYSVSGGSAVTLTSTQLDEATSTGGTTITLPAGTSSDAVVTLTSTAVDSMNTNITGDSTVTLSSGAATAHVYTENTAGLGDATLTFTLNFTTATSASTDATLSALSYSVAGGSAIALTADQITTAATTSGLSIALPKSTAADSLISFTGTCNDSGASITSNDGVALASGAGTATITVKAADASTLTYTIKFTTSAYDYVYFGQWNGSAYSTPLRWRVLSTSGNGGTYTSSLGKTISSNDALFMTADIADYSYNNEVNTFYWRTSGWGTWMQGTFQSTALTSAEQSALLNTTKAAVTRADDLSSDKLFMLSYDEVSNTSYFADDASRIVNLVGTSTPATWITRTKAGNWGTGSLGANTVTTTGSISSAAMNMTGYARPATNLNADDIVMETAAVSGKSANVLTAGTALPAFSSPYTDSYKLTIRDTANQALTVDSHSTASGVVTVAYSGATTGTNQYISAITKNASGAVTSYSKVASAATNASGSVAITLPSGFNSSTDTLYVFAEQANADYCTDYTSNLIAVEGAIPSSEKAITDFTVTGQEGTTAIDSTNHTVAITLPYGTSVASVTPTFTLSDGAWTAVNGTQQTSGTTANDFTNPVTYKVYAADGSEQDWTVTITANTVSKLKDFTAYSVAGVAGTIDTTAHTIAVSLPYGTNITGVASTFTLPEQATAKIGDVAQVSGTTTNDWTSGVAKTYTVTAGDGSTVDYAVTVTVQSNTAADITAFSVAGYDGTIDATAHTVSLTIPSTVDITAVAATFTLSDQATAKIGDVAQQSGVTTNDFTSSKTYTITAGSGATQAWTVNTTVAPVSDKAITAYSIAGQSADAVIDATNHTIKVTMPYGTTDHSALTATFATSPFSSVKVGKPLKSLALQRMTSRILSHIR